MRDWGFASLLQVKLITKAGLHRILNCFIGIGGLIGMTLLPFFLNFSEMKFELSGTPIAGALLTSSFIWWRPSFFAGMCVFGGTLFFCISRFLIARRKGISWL